MAARAAAAVVRPALTVRDIRIELDLPQHQFALLLGVATGTVSHWENGHLRPSPYRQAMLDAIAGAIERGNVEPGTRARIVQCGPVYALYRLLHSSFGVF